MDETKKIRCISNSYYNIGLKYAKIRDLSGAAEALKKSLHFSKYNTGARNLLGLIYFEMGEVAEALVQWVISLNLDPQENRAEHYLSSLQEREGYLDAMDFAVRKYNQALIHTQSGSDDLAILQLTRVIDQNRNFVKAHLLLALLYINSEEYTKAGKSLYRVLQIDKNNPKAQWYMSLVKENTGRAEIEKRKMKNAFSHRQMQDDDIILPPSYRENTGWQTVLNLIVGLLIGVLVIAFLIIPANNRILGNKHNQEMLSYSEQLNQKNLEIDSLRRDLAEAEKKQQEAEKTLNIEISGNQDMNQQYEYLVQLLQCYQREEMEQAVRIYVQFKPDVFAGTNLESAVNEIVTDMSANGYQILQNMGDREAQAGNTDQAIEYYNNSLWIHQENPYIMYQLGLMYKRKDEIERANEYFGRVIMEYPNSEYAEPAKTERGY